MTGIDDMIDAMMEDDEFRAEYQRHLLYALIHGRQGYGKNLRAKEEFMAEISNLDNVQRPATLSADRIAKPKMPQKVCNYRKPKLEWYGTQVWASGYYPNWVARHWDIRPDALYIRGADPNNGTSIFGKDDGIRGTTKTLSHKTNPWKPKGELFISSGKKLQTHVKDKDTVERVKRIEFPEA